MRTKLLTTIMASLALTATIAKAEDNQEIISVCTQKKSTYVHINTSFSLDPKDKTSFETEEKETGETYTLTKFIKAKDDLERLKMFELRNYNIIYKGKYGTSSLWDHYFTQKDGIQVNFLSEGNPLIIRRFYPGVQEQVYFFNLDNLGNGTMTMVSTRWNSPMSAANNQALFYAECSRK